MRERTGVRVAAAAAALLALAGCDGALAPPSPPGCPASGIDVSRHQGTIDWPRVAASGISFAWIKATEGGDYLDPAFRRNWLLAGAAGVRRGAYHFVYWCRAAADQGAWFASNVPDDPDALPPVLDVEWNPGSRSCPGKVDRAKALAAVKTMLEAMTRNYGARPVIYAPADLYADVLQGALADYPLWARSVDGAPDGLYDRDWRVWQFSDTARVPGVNGDVDRDCMRASPAGKR